MVRARTEKTCGQMSKEGSLLIGVHGQTLCLCSAEWQAFGSAPPRLNSSLEPRGQLRIALQQPHLLGEIPRLTFKRVFHKAMRLRTSAGSAAGSTAASVGFEEM